MRSTKRNRITYAGLGQIPVTERARPTHEIPETREQANARIRQEIFDAQPEQINQRKMDALNAELRDEFKLNAAAVKSFFGLPMSELDLKSPANAPVDYHDDYPLGTADSDEIMHARTSFIDELQSRGVTITANGFTRLSRYISTLISQRGIAPSVAALFTALNRLSTLGCFAPGEITGFTPQVSAPVAQAAPREQTSSEIIDSTLSTTREQEAALKRAVGDMWSTEFTKMFGGWIVSLRNNFNYDFPIDQLGAKAARYLDQHNLSPFAYKSYDLIRVNFVRTGLFPDHMMTEAERLADFIENSDMSDRETRQRVALWQRDILENGPPLPLHK